MNIFCIDENPIQAARWLCDQHCNKMVLESAQMLANCFTSETLEDAPRAKSGNVRKHSYYNHPCSIWVRESTDNMIWLILHALEMEEERLRRGFNPHFSVSFIDWCADNVARSFVPLGKQTDFAIAISPDKDCRKHSEFNSLDTVGKYRLYYALDKKFAKWTQNKPAWI